jgi:hypothetical protein
MFGCCWSHGPTRNQGIQIDHRAVFPEKRTPHAPVTRNRNAAYLTSIVDAPRLAVAVPCQESEIRSYAIIPEGCIVRPVGKYRATGNYSGVIDHVCVKEATSSTLRSQVNQFCTIPK